jgi:hypothetical protein
MAKKQAKPELLYVHFDDDGDVIAAYTDPSECVGCDDVANMTRYRFDGNVEIELRAVVTDVK